MAIYLNNINLNGNQLQKAVIHPLSTAPSTAAEGQVYYDLEDNVVYVNTSTTVNSPTWVNMQSGDLTGITITTDSGAGAPASDTSGSADFSILGTSGVGVTNSGATITVTSVPGEIDHDSLLNFASNEHFTQGNITTVGTIGTGVWQGTAIAHDYIGADAIDGTNIANDAVDTEHIADDAIEEEHIGAGEVKTDAIADANVTLAKLANIATDTFIGRTAANAGVPKALSKAEALAILNVADGAQVNVAPTTDQVKTALNANLGTVTFGDANDEINFSGNITVTGTTTMSGGTVINTTTNTAIKDTTIVLNSGIGTSANASDIGMILDRGSLGNAFMGWDESENEFIMIKTSTEGSDDGATAINGSATGVAIENDAAYLHLKVGSLELANGGINLAGHAMNDVDITSESTDADDHLMSALAIKNRILDFGYTTNTGTTTAANTQTFTNKSIDANGTGNAITNIDIGNMTGAVVQLSSESFSDNDTSFMTSAAINDRFAQINANTTGTAAGLSATLAVASGGTGATSLDGAGIVEKSGAQTISGAKTFSGGLILDDGSGASPILKFRNQDNDYWTLSTQNTTNNLLFYEGTTLRVTFADGGDVVIPGSIDLGGSIDVDGTMEADAITLGGSSVHATDTNTSLGTSNTVVPSQNAVKTYVDAQGSSSSNTGGRQAFVLAAATSGVAATSTTVFTITHGMGASRNYGVEIIRNSANSGGGETVIVDVARPTDTTITVTFAVAPTAGDYTALVCKY